MEFGPLSDEAASEDAKEPLLRGRQPAAGRSNEGPSTQSVLLIGTLLACVLWLLPPLDVLAPAPSLESLLPLTHGRKQAALDAAPQAATRAADTAPRRELQSGPVDSSSSPRPAPVALAAAAPPQHPTAAEAGRAAPRRDLVFGVVAFRPDSGCTQSKHAGQQCDRSPYYKGLRRWVRSIRMVLTPERADVLIFTGAGKGSLASDPTTGRWLQEQGVRLVEGDYADSASRVAHTDPSRYVWCVMRNRWFVIAEYLQRHSWRYRNVLMSDTKDAVLQADPFAAVDMHGAIVFSGEGGGKVLRLRDSKKGLPRTLNCARGVSPEARLTLGNTEPLNAGVTAGDARAFANFSSALSRLVAHVTTTACLATKDCTDQGLYNLLVYHYWHEYLPHTRKVVRPLERALSYTLGHKKGCCRIDADGHVLNDGHQVPAVVHQYNKGAAGKALKRTRFGGRYLVS